MGNFLMNLSYKSKSEKYGTGTELGNGKLEIATKQNQKKKKKKLATG